MPGLQRAGTAWQYNSACINHHSILPKPRLSRNLFLRVDHERPASAAGDENGVLGGDQVARQTVGVPLPYLVRVRQDADDRHRRRDRDLQLDAALRPALDQQVAVDAREGAVVGDARRRHEHVSHHVADHLLRVLRSVQFSSPRLTSCRVQALRDHETVINAITHAVVAETEKFSEVAGMKRKMAQTVCTTAVKFQLFILSRPHTAGLNA